MLEQSFKNKTVRGIARAVFQEPLLTILAKNSIK